MSLYCKLGKLSGLAILLLSLVACSSVNELSASKEPNIKLKRSGTVNVASRATGIESDKIGRTTVLTIPVGRIKARGDTSAQIMQGIEQALEAAGYNDPKSAAYAAEDAAYIKAHVEEIAMGNFLASSWATLIVHVRLETRDGALLWKKRIRTSINALNNYNRTATVAMNELVEDMAKAFIEEDFYQATLRIKRHKDFVNEQISAPSSSEPSTESI